MIYLNIGRTEFIESDAKQADGPDTLMDRCAAALEKLAAQMVTKEFKKRR